MNSIHLNFPSYLLLVTVFVKNEELRENPYVKSKSSDIDKSIKFDNLFNFLCDCQLIICKNIDKTLSEKFKQVGIKIYKTLEDSARKGIINTICR